jgi:Fe-S-cluster-containing hydrogenase component 2
MTCKLCVAACPTGAISPKGVFNFSACYTHNYREFMGGFTDWVETVASSGSARNYRKKVTDQETASIWQSLAYGPNYKAAYCIAVCPAGDEVSAPFHEDRASFVKEIVKPLQEKQETVYVVAGSDAEAYAQKRFPHKIVKRVSNGLRPVTAAGFLRALPHVFQPGASKGLEAVYHFTFTGRESLHATVVIRDQKIQVLNGHQETPDLRVIADSESWVAFIRKDKNLLELLLIRKIRIQGAVRLLKAFARCFPA